MQCDFPQLVLTPLNIQVKSSEMRLKGGFFGYARKRFLKFTYVHLRNSIGVEFVDLSHHAFIKSLVDLELG